jgi:uncharacterized protein with von Willebrand factor type A (vWA) domain
MSFLDNLIERGKSLLGDIPKPTQEYVVDHDRFDKAYYDDVVHKVPGMNTLITDLSRKHDYVEPFMQDFFMSLLKADPQLHDEREMKPTHVPNRTMIKELTETTQFRQLRANTRGDEYGSAMALLGMESALRQAQDAMVEAKKRAEEAQQAQDKAKEADDDVKQIIEGFGIGPSPDPNGQPGDPGQGNAGGALQQALDKAQQAQGAAQAAQNAAQAAAELAAQGVKQSVKTAAKQAGEELEQEQALCQAFGMEDGALQRMDFEERRQLAERLRNNRLSKFYKLLGQFKMIQQAESRKRIMHATDEVVGVKLDDDLTRMIPAEMINLASPELEADFWMRYANREILCYDLRGKENLGQGPVVCVVDESGSMGCEDVMGGSREAWSKALALAMCDQARQRGRDFHYIGFSSSRQVWTQSFLKGETTLDGVLTMTEHFYGGGTSYEEPLRAALKLIEESYDNSSKGKADVVFMTDDEYGSMDEDFMHEWNRVKDKTSIRCFGIAIGCSYGGALESVSDNVRSITDMLESDPQSMADLFRTV